MAKRQGETALRDAVANLLEINGWTTWRIYVGPVMRNDKGGEKIPCPNPMAGFSDLIAIKKCAETRRIRSDDVGKIAETFSIAEIIFVETKMPKGRHADAQIAFGEKVRSVADSYFLVRSYDDAEKQFKTRGVI